MTIYGILTTYQGACDNCKATKHPHCKLHILAPNFDPIFPNEGIHHARINLCIPCAEEMATRITNITHNLPNPQTT